MLAISGLLFISEIFCLHIGHSLMYEVESQPSMHFLQKLCMQGVAVIGSFITSIQMAHSSWLEISSLTSSEASTIFTSPLGFCPAASIAESYFLALSKIDCAL